MAELKTKPTKASVKQFIDKVGDESRRKDCRKIIELMTEATGTKPEMWGSSIVGFGRYHYKYDSGREGEWMVTGFSPRKTDLTLYITAGLHLFPELLERLGKYKTGKSCLYLKKLDDVDLGVLKKLIKQSVERMSKYRIDK